ncbi:MAG: hypothetical protein COB85_09625 [Bacteroidetes bacterium]|nr:MAG: hypothetical protein COB85_09625 [Bacteroidota bacterium]
MELKTFIFMGRSGCGKGTQAELLQEKLGLDYVGSGNLLRARVETEDFSGRKLKLILSRITSLNPIITPPVAVFTVEFTMVVSESHQFISSSLFLSMYLYFIKGPENKLILELGNRWCNTERRKCSSVEAPFLVSFPFSLRITPARSIILLAFSLNNLSYPILNWLPKRWMGLK